MPKPLIKHPREVRHYRVDFSRMLVESEWIQSVISIEIAPVGVLQFKPYYLPSQAKFIQLTLSEGINQTDYRILILVETNQGQILEGLMPILVRNS